MTAAENAERIARQLVEQQGLEAPALATEAARQRAREGDLIACREWVRVSLAAERLISAEHQKH